MCCRCRATILPLESGEAPVQLPLWQRRPHETSLTTKADSLVSSHDEATFLQMQQRRLQAVPVPYAEPVLPEGTDELLLAARPGQCPLLLVGARTSTGGRTQRDSKKEQYQVVLYDVGPDLKSEAGKAGEPLWSEKTGTLLSLCWDFGGGCFAAASERESEKGCQIDIWSIHDGSEISVGRLVDTMYRSWRIHALCFSGFCLAVAAKGACCSFVSLVDVDTAMEVNRLILPNEEPRCVSHFLLSSEGISMERLVLAADRRVLLWNLEGMRTGTGYVDVEYHSGGHRMDISLSRDDERNKLTVLQVQEQGPAYDAGVRGACGWMLAGWRPLSPLDGCYALRMPFSLESLGEMAKTKEVQLRFQPPDLDIATLELDFHVDCTAPSEDGTMLAVGCKRFENFEGGRMRSGGEGSTLSVWSLETQEFWRARELHVTSSIPSLCWLSRSELVVALGTLDAVGLVNVESGALVRRWSFQPWKPTAVTGTSGWIAAGIQTGTRFKRRVTVFNASSSGCVLSAALLNTFKLKRCPPVVALNEQGQFLAVAGLDGTERLELTSDGSTCTPTTLSSDTGKTSRGLSVWQLEDTKTQKVTAFSCNPLSVAVSRSLLVACFQDSSQLKAYRLPEYPSQAFRPQVELCTAEHSDKLRCVAVKESTDGTAVAAALGKVQSSPVVGLACWLGPEPQQSNLLCAKHVYEVMALAFLPHHNFLVGLLALSQSAGMCCIWNLCCPGRAELCSELRLEGADAAGVLAVGHDDVAATRARSPRRARLTDLGLLAKEEAPPALLATAGEAARIAVHETRTGYRSVLEIDERRTVKVLRFAASGKVLVAGDSAGRVHLFGLGRGRAPHRVLCLGGEVVDIVLQEEQLSRVACWQGRDRDKASVEPGEENKVLVYDLLNPSLEFLLPDLKMKAEDSSAAFFAQLELMPSLLHQQLPGLGWTLLHCCACRGAAHHAKLLVRQSASPFQLDGRGRNVLDVALDHNEFGVVEDLMTVLMQEQRSPESFGWEHFGEKVEVLGRALLSSSLPAEHLALTRTVIRLLRFRTATLPDFLDTVCWGTPRHFEVTRAGEHLKSLPSRAALLEHQMVIRSYCAPFYRPDSQELQGLAPSFEDNESSAVPERPVEIRVWYLRGALDDEMGIIRALKESEQEEIMRTKFVQFLLEELWTTLGWRQFRLDLILYLVHLLSFMLFCVSGRESCDDCEELRGFWGLAFQILRVVLIIFQLFFLCEELKQLRYELRRAEAHGLWAKLRAFLHYFTTWNNLDITRIALVCTTVVHSMIDREGLFLDEGPTVFEGRNLLAITSVFVCFRLASFLRAWSSTGHLVRTLITIFWDIKSFFWVMSVMLLTFVFAFLLLFDQPFTVEGLGATMWYVYMHGIFGDAADAPAGTENGATATARVLLVCCVLVMLVVMMNFLIAIMSDSYDKVQESAEVARNVMRLELVYEAEVADFVRKRAKQPKAYVFTCQGVRYTHGPEAVQQEHSRWEGRVRQVEKVVRREARQTNESLLEQAGQLASIEDRIQTLESHLNQGHGRLQETVERIMEQVKGLSEQRSGPWIEGRTPSLVMNPLSRALERIG